MRMLKGLVTFTIILLSSHAYSYESVQLIEVFVNSKVMVPKTITNQLGKPVEVIVYDLSGPEKFEKILSEGIDLKNITHEQRTNAVIKQVHEMPKQYMEKHIANAYLGVLKAKQYQVTKIPALVFNNGESVIYGVSNIRKGIKIHQEINQ